MYISLNTVLLRSFPSERAGQVNNVGRKEWCECRGGGRLRTGGARAPPGFGWGGTVVLVPPLGFGRIVGVMHNF